MFQSRRFQARGGCAGHFEGPDHWYVSPSLINFATRHETDIKTEAFGIKGSVEGRKDGNSKNLDQIRVFLEKTNLFNIIGMDSSSNPRTFALPPRYYTEYLYAIQCTLAAELFALNKPWSQVHISFPDAQMMAYSDPITAPILFGPCGVDINFKWLLRNLQFWHQHLNHQNEVLTDAFEALAESDRPALFAEQLHDEPASLGRMWKGSYAFVDRGSEISNIRSGANLNQPIMDQLSGEGDEYPFQDLVLQFPEDDSAGPWPRAFERILHSIVMPLNRVTPTAPQHATSRISAQNFTEMSTRILGSGHDSADDFQADGWLNPLPPQHEIPGWQRFTLMKFFQHEDNGEIDLDNLWAYEGIVLPGGKIIVGRWWCPSDGDGLQMYSGPFILWNVADAPTSNDKGQSGYCKAEGEAKKKF